MLVYRFYGIDKKSKEEMARHTLDFFQEGIQNGTFIAFLAEVGETIVGTSGMVFYRVPPTYQNIYGKSAYLMNMYTLPEYRKQGIGTNLLQCIMDEAQKRGVVKITLNASAMGKPLYEKYGFTDLKNEMVFYLK